MKRLSEPLELGRYRLVAELGRGAMGIVYLGVTEDGTLVALKRVREQFLDDDEFRARFRREVDSSKKVSGPRTAAVIDADVDDNPPWLASEFVYGPTLEAAIAEVGQLPESSVLLLAQGLASALSDIHRTGLIHRDLKPSNVILAPDGPRVIDFGIARAAETEGGTDITHTSWLLGSPGYMSPEQAESKALTTASDLFSMATVLYVASTGTNPFKGAGSPQTMYNVVHAEPDLDVLPDAVREIVEPCWAKDPEARPTAAQLLDRIPVAAERPWPEGLVALAAAQRVTVAGMLPDDTVRFHDGGTQVLPEDAEAPQPEPAAAEAPDWEAPGPDPAASPAPGVDPAWAPPPPGSEAFDAPPPPPPAPPFAPTPTPAFGSALTTGQIAGIVVAGVVGLLLVAGLISVGIDSQNASDSSDSATSDYDYGNDEETTYDDYTDDGYTEDDYTEPEPTQDDIVDVSAGDCVYGSPDVGANWDIQSCGTGNFTVLERIDGSGDYNACDSSDHMLDYGQQITDYGDTNFVLCLSMNWAQGDIGHAPQDTCLYRTGSGGSAVFEFVECDQANAIVTGFNDNYDDAGFCSGYGYASAQDPTFDIAYTVCYSDY
ncbi:serine/threonine protein kinase [Stackebrandtia nassauensis]|uniref:Serine/threonine protein kinase n=1 Tax=Stackebrandtia nassauensis (strain DSM 44728 / CIP 108903 / NRRL B-16338 / NBRC 102104 / LLR-40K-21) TaxID=446470 RepID=D3QBY9_STANL|nr:serine/threonine-protein kinase [Stackebrandtia nassauensis]ADD44878.1 serine/threonine protein kinase [Stackebrandtia nassauensis DSM 44728]